MDLEVSARRVNHVALRVGDLDASVDFYCRYLGFTEPFERYKSEMAFLRASGSRNNHDLALVQGAVDSATPAAASGLLHVAFEVGTLEELGALRERFIAEGIFDRELDHGATKSVYAFDPDGNNIEVMWMIPPELWGEWATRTPDRLPLDLAAELERYGAPSGRVNRPAAPS